jgi:hypothetical protein
VETGCGAIRVVSRIEDGDDAAGVVKQSSAPDRDHGDPVAGGRASVREC